MMVVGWRAMIWVASWGVGRLPRRIQLLLGRGLGILLFIVKPRAQVVYSNLQRAFPEDPRLCTRYFREFYNHMGHIVVETLFLLDPRMGFRRWVEQNVLVEGFEHWQQAHALGQGVIFLSSHVGNWEVMAATGGHTGTQLMLVTKLNRPLWFHQLVESARRRLGVEATYEPRTLRDVLSHLRKGRTVGFILDQYAGPPVSVRVPFFGIPVGTHTVVATVAKKTQAPVVPVVNYRLPDGRWKVVLQAALPWIEEADSALEIAKNTARYSEIIEKNVREHPDQWLWSHRRFKGDLSPLRAQEWSEVRTRK